MSKQTREAKKKRARSRRRRGWASAAPYVLVVGLAAGIAAALFLVSAGGGGSDGAAASHPPGYTPPTLGEASAPVEFVLWEDFQCPFCKRFTLNTFPDLKRRFVDTGKVRFVWRNFQRYGSESFDSGVAAYCAGEQGKFWEYKETLFEHQRGIQTGAFSRSNLGQFARDLGLDVVAYNECFDGRSEYYLDIMAADRALARDQGVNGTPSFFINGELVVGAQPTETFVNIIESKLRQAGEPEG